MKHKIISKHRKNFDPKYNPHLKRNYHSKLRAGKHIGSWILMAIMGIIVIIVIATAGGIWMYRDANEQARQNVNAKVERNARPKSAAYDQASLNQHSNHQTAKDMAVRYANQDEFISKINYNSKKDVAKVYLTKASAKAINYASNTKKPKATQLTKSIQTGVRIDNVLSDQAVKVANAAHDGYFTFTFANASKYQAPNTKTGNYNE